MAVVVVAMLASPRFASSFNQAPLQLITRRMQVLMPCQIPYFYRRLVQYRTAEWLPKFSPQRQHVIGSA
jgi:hypothetical protein